MSAAPRWIVAKCPPCGAACLDVRLGRKTTVRETTCRLCGRRYSYSAWTLRTLAHGDHAAEVHQVDLVPIQPRRA